MDQQSAGDNVRDFSSSSQAVSGRYILWILLYVFLAVLLDLCLESPHTSENQRGRKLPVIVLNWLCLQRGRAAEGRVNPLHSQTLKLCHP